MFKLIIFCNKIPKKAKVFPVPDLDCAITLVSGFFKTVTSEKYWIGVGDI